MFPPPDDLNISDVTIRTNECPVYIFLHLANVTNSAKNPRQCIPPPYPNNATTQTIVEASQA